MIEWAITSSVLILVVLVLRRCLMGRMSLRLQYGLWALVLLRLLLPVSIGGTAVSVLNSVAGAQEQISAPVVVYLGSEEAPSPTPEPEPSLSQEASGEQVTPSQPQRQAEQERVQGERGTPISLGMLLRIVWSVGAVGLGLWLLWVNVRFAGALRLGRRPLTVEQYPLPVYVTGATQTPCLFGLIRPCVYVTEEVASDETVLRHSLAHELTHYRHGDHLWAALRGLSLALHWYNPLVWVAAVLSRRDGELCCDEATVRRLGEGERAAYGRTLLSVTCQGRSNPLLTATSMTGSGKGIKERILLLTKRPRTAVYTLVTVICIAAVAVGCTFTGAQKDASEVPITLAEGLDLPEAVSAYAREHVSRALTDCTEELGCEITGAEIVGLTPVNTGTAGETSGQDLYLLEYRLHTAHPDQVELAKGMRMEEDAITEWRSTGQPYLLLHWENAEGETNWEPVCVTDTATITQEYGTAEMLEEYGNAYTAAAMELYEQFVGDSAMEEEPRAMTAEDVVRKVAYGLLDAEVCLQRDGYDRPVGPGNWTDLFVLSEEGEPEIRLLEGYEPLYGEGDYWDQWSVAGFSALRYYAAAENTWSANTIDVTRTDLVTPRGVRVGDSRAQVLQAYPEALTGDYWGAYPEAPDMLAYVAWSGHTPGEIHDLSQLEFHEMLGPAILFFFEGDVLRQITLTNMFN